MKRHSIDLILPCYNPPETWVEGVLEHYEAICKEYKYCDFKLHIVNDGSQKGYDSKNLEHLRTSINSVDLVLYDENRGKGYALREAVKKCTHEYMIYTDYDFPYTSESFHNVLMALLDGADVVVAARGKEYQKRLPRLRRFLSFSSHCVNYVLLGLKVHDTQGGMKGFNQRGRDIFLSTTIDTFLFDTQFIYKANKIDDVCLVQVDASIRSDIHLSRMGWKVFFREFANIYKVLTD